MNIKLDEKYTWDQLAQITLSKIAHTLKPTEHKNFLKWFKERKKIGYNFDYRLWARCYRIYQELENCLDHFIVIDGREGTGKSTLANQIAATIIPHHRDQNNCTRAAEYIETMRLKAQQNKGEPNTFDAIILDEGTELLSRESYNMTNRVLVKTFFIQRALKFLVIVCIPNFHMLDSVIRQHRVRTLINIEQRGKYKAITGKGIKIIAKEGQKNKEVNTIKLPNGTFWQGYFTGTWPKTMDYNKYLQIKHEGIKELLENLKDDVIQIKMISARKVAREIQASKDTIIGMIKKGDLEGKQIGNKWYVTRRGYDQLMLVTPKKPQNPTKNAKIAPKTNIRGLKKSKTPPKPERKQQKLPTKSPKLNTQINI